MLSRVAQGITAIHFRTMASYSLSFTRQTPAGRAAALISDVYWTQHVQGLTVTEGEKVRPLCPLCSSEFLRGQTAHTPLLPEPARTRRRHFARRNHRKALGRSREDQRCPRRIRAAAQRGPRVARPGRARLLERPPAAQGTSLITRSGVVTGSADARTHAPGCRRQADQQDFCRRRLAHRRRPRSLCRRPPVHRQSRPLPSCLPAIV